MNKIFKTLAILVATFSAGLIGMLFVSADVGTWYASLAKPPFTPPNTLFPVVWTILYVLMSLACAIVWAKEPQNTHTESWVRFYFVHLLFNAGWTIFFFGFHALTISLINTFVLFFFALSLAASAWAIDRRATYLMLPYCLWLFFAFYLTAGIWFLN